MNHKETFDEFTTTMNYIAVGSDTPGPQGVQVRLKNGRSENFQLKGDGIQLLSGVHLPVTDFSKESVELRNEIKDQFEKLAKELTGAYRCTVFPPFVRSEAEASKEKNAVEDLRAHRNNARPHDIVHNDYDEKYRKFLDESEPGLLRRVVIAPRREIPSDEALVQLVKSVKRVVVLQFWASAQPEGTVIEHHPLAICAPRSVTSRSHCVPVPLPEYGGFSVGEMFGIYLANADHAKDHEWFYFPKMTRNEMMAWVGYDSLESPFLPAFHSAFEYPKHLDGSTPRQSIEVRVMCFLDHDEPFFPRRSPQGMRSSTVQSSSSSVSSRL